MQAAGAQVVDATPIDPVRRYLSRLSPSSRRVQARALATVAERLWGPGRSWETGPWHKITMEELHYLRETLPGTMAIATVNRHLAATRAVIRICRRLGWSQMNEEDLAGCPKIRGELPLGGRAVSTPEIMQLMEYLARDDSALGRRNGFLLAILWGMGLRVAEACTLRRHDVCFGKLRVRGKGMRYRLLPIAKWLRPWFAARLGDLPDDPNVRLLGIKPNRVRAMLRERCRELGLPSCSPHDFRRGFITYLLQRGTDVFTVARLAGHSSLLTTMRYDRRDDETAADAMDRMLVKHETIRQLKEAPWRRVERSKTSRSGSRRPRIGRSGSTRSGTE